MSIVINGIKMPEAPDEMIELAIYGDGSVIQTCESWRSPEDGKCYYTIGQWFLINWISIYDKLPPTEKEVYVTDGEYIARANLLDEVFPGDKPCWSYSGLGEITHWCEQIPLPQPPKER